MNKYIISLFVILTLFIITLSSNNIILKKEIAELKDTIWQQRMTIVELEDVEFINEINQ